MSRKLSSVYNSAASFLAFVVIVVIANCQLPHFSTFYLLSTRLYLNNINHIALSTLQMTSIFDYDICCQIPSLHAYASIDRMTRLNNMDILKIPCCESATVLQYEIILV